jgi:hypothetical protein
MAYFWREFQLTGFYLPSLRCQPHSLPGMCLNTNMPCFLRFHMKNCLVSTWEVLPPTLQLFAKSLAPLLSSSTTIGILLAVLEILWLFYTHKAYPGHSSLMLLIKLHLLTVWHVLGCTLEHYNCIIEIYNRSSDASTRGHTKGLANDGFSI